MKAYCLLFVSLASILLHESRAAVASASERKEENMALIINKGFKDLLFIGNQARPNMFELDINRPRVLYSEVVELDRRNRRQISDDNNGTGNTGHGNNGNNNTGNNNRGNGNGGNNNIGDGNTGHRNNGNNNSGNDNQGNGNGGNNNVGDGNTGNNNVGNNNTGNNKTGNNM